MTNPYALITPEKIAPELARRLRALRLARGWKQATLAERSGVSLASVRRFEARGQASLHHFLAMVFALGRLEDFENLLEPPAARTMAELEALDQTPRRQRGRL